MKRLPTLFILLLMMVSSCQPIIDPEEELLDLQQAVTDFNQAFVEADIQKLEAMTTAGYLHTNGSQSPIKKEAWLDYLKKRKKQFTSGQLLVTQYQFLQAEYNLYPQAALVNGLIRVSGNIDHTPFDRSIRVSMYWIKESGLWKRAGFHDTRLE